MKLIGYEFYKLLKNRYFIFIWAAVLIASAAIFANGCYEESMRCDKTLFAETLSEYRQMPDEQAYEAMQEKQNDLSSLQTVNFKVESGYDRETAIKLYDLEHELYGQKSYAELEELYPEYIADADLLSQENIVLCEIISGYQSMLAYDEFISGMQERADVSLSSSIFQDENTFFNRDIYKTLADYSGLTETELEVDLRQGVLHLSEDEFSDWAVLFFILICTVLIFSSEWENGIIYLAQVNRKGKLSLIAAKLVTLLLLAFSTLTASYFIRWGIADAVLGMGDLSRPLQSISAFRDCCLSITVGGYLTAAWLLKFAAIFLTAALTAAMFLLFKRVKIASAITVLILCGEYLGYQMIAPQSIWNPIKYVNLFSLLDVHGRFSTYQNLNLFGYPVSIYTVMLPLFAVLAAGLIFLLFVCHCRQWTVRISIPPLQKLFAFLKRKTVRRSTSLLRQESGKFWLQSKGILFLVLLLVIAWTRVETGNLFFTAIDVRYMQYATQFAGELTEEKEQLLQEEQARYDSIWEDIDELSAALARGEITQDEYEVERAEIDSFSGGKTAFTHVSTQYETLKEKKAQGYDVQFIDQVKAEYFFSHSTDMLYSGLIFALVCLFACGSLFAGEYEGNMLQLIRTTQNGQKRLFWTKYGVMLSFYCIAFAGYFAPEWYNWLHKYEMTNLDAPIQSIERFANLETNLSIFGFTLIWYAFMFLAGLQLLCLLSLVSDYLRDVSNTLICGCVWTVLVFLIAILAPYSVITRFMPSAAFIVPKLFLYQENAAGIYLLPILQAGICALLIIVHRRRFVRMRR